MRTASKQKRSTTSVLLPESTPLIQPSSQMFPVALVTSRPPPSFPSAIVELLMMATHRLGLSWLSGGLRLLGALAGHEVRHALS